MKTTRVNPLAAAMQRALASALEDTASAEPATAPPPPTAAPTASASRPASPREAAPTTAAAASVASKDVDLAAPHIDLPSSPRAFQPAATYSFRLRLSGRVASRYIRPDRDVEEVMEERLERCAAHDAETPLTFTDDQRRQLLDLLGTADPESVLRHVANLVTAGVNTAEGGVSIGRLQFSAEQLERTAFRCVGTETIEQKLQEFCNYGVNANVGLS